MPEHVSSPVTVRRWNMEVGRLRSRASKMSGRRADAPPEAVNLIDATLRLSESLLQDLAGAELRAAALDQQALTLHAMWDAIFERMPVACLEVDDSGAIIAANRMAGVLLNTSTRHLENRLLLHFTEDREAFSAFFRGVPFAPDLPQARMRIRPRERAAVDVEITVVGHTPGVPGTRLWFVTPLSK